MIFTNIFDNNLQKCIFVSTFQQLTDLAFPLHLHSEHLDCWQTWGTPLKNNHMYQHESLTLRKRTNQNKADMDIHVFLPNSWRKLKTCGGNLVYRILIVKVAEKTPRWFILSPVECTHCFGHRWLDLKQLQGMRGLKNESRIFFIHCPNHCWQVQLLVDWKLNQVSPCWNFMGKEETKKTHVWTIYVSSKG